MNAYMPRHKNGGPMNMGRGPTHKGWALHKLRAHQKKHGYRRPIGAGPGQRHANGSRP